MQAVLKVVSVLLLVQLGLGWWDVGHMLVSRIAEAELQKTDPQSYEKFDALVKSLNPMTDGRTQTFVEAAVWPDDIKNYGANLFNNYHFTDRIYDPDGMMPSMSDTAKYNNSLNLLGWCMNVLKKNKLNNTFERAFTARFLLHLVGDVHQPLHSVQMFNTTKALINGDQGGNLINITTVEGQVFNLHSFLDSIARIIQGKDDMPLERPLGSYGSDYIASLARNIQGAYPKEYFGAAVNDLTFNTWTMESYDAAVQHIYSFVLKNNKATPEWTLQIFELCRQRIALAGYRLAKLIPTIYA